ncbi:MAG: hypothetical protein ACYTE8_02945 [Planctomycetota bacterium]|jgi:hypothetical protein
MKENHKDNALTKEDEIIEYTRTSIFERRKTQYILLIFYIGVVGACVGLVLNNYTQLETNKNLILILLYPIFLIAPFHMLYWYHNWKIEDLDAKLRSIIPDLKPWQSPMGIASFDIVLLTPLVGLPALGGILLNKCGKSFFDVFCNPRFLCILGLMALVCVEVAWVEILACKKRKKRKLTKVIK